MQALCGAENSIGGFSNVQWIPLTERTKLAAHEEKELCCVQKRLPFTHIKLMIFPDGGISRLKVLGNLFQS